MDGACSTNTRQECCIQGFGGDLRDRDHLEDLDIDGRMLLKWILKV